MKLMGLLLLVGLMFSCSSCSNVEFNNPAFQADLNNNLWKAEVFSASYDEDENLIITATNNIETLVLTVQLDNVGANGLGPDWKSKAEFIDSFGNIYTTDIEPDETISIYRDLGRINITSKDEASNTFTGDFYFIAYDENGQNPIGMSNGLFLNVKAN